MKRATWIWYPSDFELELANRCMTRRYERDVFIPPFWYLPGCCRNVKFYRDFRLNAPDEIKVRCEGRMNLLLNDAYVYGFDGTLRLDAGAYRLVASVYNESGLPCLLAEGRELVTDASWRVSCNDHITVPVGTQAFVNPQSTPNRVKLCTEELLPERIFEYEGRAVYDFGRELMARVHLEVSAPGRVFVSYGESVEEAADIGHAELCDELEAASAGPLSTDLEKAFRYLVFESDTEISRVRAENEFLPLVSRGRFSCSDETLNRIYGTALYTLQMNAREFLLDGIKRDRWIWAGDAYQGYLMNYYSFFDRGVVHRTMLALFGKRPVRTYTNHIMDYSFFWIMGLHEYFAYTGDLGFVESQLDNMIDMMEFCISRTNENGLMNGKEEDWVFVDWAELDNSGEVCFEQMLFGISLRDAEALCRLLGRDAEAERYRTRKEDVLAKLEKFWDEERGAYLYSYKNGEPDGVVTRHANMFAVLYGLCGEERKQRIRTCVLMDPGVPAITTPYMRFYELAALCEVGEYEYVLGEIASYWGGMLDAGATSFWETFDKNETGPERYAMYGRKYGKSLCHTWGASPVYLLGRYFAGIRPSGREGYDFEARPQRASLEWFEASVPVREGDVTLRLRGDRLEIESRGVRGLLCLAGRQRLAGAPARFDGRETLVEVPAGVSLSLRLERREKTGNGI